MTLKKLNRSAQAIFEYFILTTVVVAVVLFFAASVHFRKIKDSCSKAFDDGVGEILR